MRYTKGRDPIKKMHKVICLFAILLALLIADSTTRLTVTEYTISSDRLPNGFDGYRIVQLSDLHAKEFGTDNSRLVEKVTALQPDLIALTGDYIETEHDLSIVETLVAQLSEIAPVYYSSGNHDWSSKAIPGLRQAVADGGGKYLSNEYLELTCGDDTIVLAGVEDPNSLADLPHPDDFMEEVISDYPDKYIILLAHRNNYIVQYPDLPCDIVFVGHGHGGIVRLPFVGGLLGVDKKFFPKYDAGLFEGERYTMVVSRGLGDIPLLPRIGNNPEIVVVTLSQK